MSNTITSISQRLPAQTDLLGKAAKTPKNEFADTIAKTRDRDGATTQVEPENTAPQTPKTDAGAQPDTTVAKSLIAPAPPQNDDILSWLGMPGLKSVTFERRMLTATFGDQQTTPPVTTPVVRPVQDNSFASLKDLMKWFFGDMGMDLPAPAPAPTPAPAPAPRPTPAPTPPPTPTANGVTVAWDGGKVTNPTSATDNAPKTEQPKPMPPVAVDTPPVAYGWKDLMSLAFSSAKATLEKRDNAFTLQMEMRKMNALFGRQDAAAERTGVVA